MGGFGKGVELGPCVNVSNNMSVKVPDNFVSVRPTIMCQCSIDNQEQVSLIHPTMCQFQTTKHISLPDPRGAGYVKAFPFLSVGPSVGRSVRRSVSLIVSVGPSVGRSKDD